MQINCSRILIEKLNKKRDCKVSFFVVAGAGLEPATFGLCVPLRLSPPDYVSSWSGLSLHPQPDLLGCLPSSLYTFPETISKAWLGITFTKGFPEFDK